MLSLVRKIASGASLLCGVLLLLTSLILPFRAINPQLDFISPLVPFVFWSATALVLCTFLFRIVFARSRAPRVGLLVSGTACAISAMAYLPEHFDGPAVQLRSSRGADCLVVLTANLSPNVSALGPFIELVRNKQPDILLLQEAYELPARLRSSLSSYRFAAGCEEESNCNAAVLITEQAVVKKAWVTNGFAAAELQIGASNSPDRSLWAVSVHLSRGQPVYQSVQIRKLAFVVGQDSDAAIVAGDFNLVPWSSLMAELERKLSLTRWTRDFPTWPTRSWLRSQSGFAYGVPLFAIDHILAGAHWVVVAKPEGFDFGSDHYAVVTTLCPRS